MAHKTIALTTELRELAALPFIWRVVSRTWPSHPTTSANALGQVPVSRARHVAASLHTSKTASSPFNKPDMFTCRAAGLPALRLRNWPLAYVEDGHPLLSLLSVETH